METNPASDASQSLPPAQVPPAAALQSPPISAPSVTTHATQAPRTAYVPPHQEQHVVRKEFHVSGMLRDLALSVFVPAVFMVALGVFQSMFPERLYSNGLPSDFDMPFEDVTLTTADGLKLAAWYVPSKDGDNSSAVLVLHGYPADKGDLLDRSSFLSGSHALLYVDFRYFGKSEGKYTTVGIREVEDALAGIAELRRRGADRIGIYGFSLGGSVALQALDRSDEVTAVVAEAPYANIRAIAEEPYKYLGPLKVPLAAVTAFVARVITGVDTYEVSPLAAAERTVKPVLLIHSRADEVVPFKNAELLRNALARDPEAQFLFFDDLSHGAASAEFASDVKGFFDVHLNQTTP